jgi:hypothetical protein
MNGKPEDVELRWGKEAEEIKVSCDALAYVDPEREYSRPIKEGLPCQMVRQHKTSGIMVLRIRPSSSRRGDLPPILRRTASKQRNDSIQDRYLTQTEREADEGLRVQKWQSSILSASA